MDLNCHAGRQILIINADDLPIQEIELIRIQTKIKDEIVDVYNHHMALRIH